MEMNNVESVLLTIDVKNVFYVFYKSLKNMFVMFFYVFFCAFCNVVFLLLLKHKRPKLQI